MVHARDVTIVNLQIISTMVRKLLKFGRNSEICVTFPVLSLQRATIQEIEVTKSCNSSYIAENCF
jgi:hypothetical protein